MNQNPIKTLTLKGLSLFFYINFKNLVFVLIALYFSAIFIFKNQTDYLEILKQTHFHFIIWAALFSIAAGYIIHYFYEEEVQKIKLPFQTYFRRFISRSEYLIVYILFNTFSLILAGLVSIKVLFFFFTYQFLIWLYAHKLSRNVFLGNLSKATLTLMPFVALMFYFKNFTIEIFDFGLLLFLLILIKEIIKDGNTLFSDALLQKETLPNTIGLKNTAKIVQILLVLAIFLNLFLPFKYDLGIMEFYLYTSAIIYSLVFILLQSKFFYKWLISLWVMRIWIAVGILSIPFIDWNVERIINHL